jgi:hypothetical protein
MRGDSGFWQLECFVLNSDDITFDTNEKIKIEPIILNVNSNDIRQYYVNPKSYIENIDEFLFNQAIQVMCKDIWRFPLERGNGDIYGTNN